MASVEQELDVRAVLARPILDIAARFWDEDRYAAFGVCYRAMRRIDDLVDGLKEGGGALSPARASEVRAEVTRWLDSLRRRDACDPGQEELIDTLERFRVPLWPWERFAGSMVYDLEHNGFASFRGFLRYAEGAAVAPAAIFVHLCGVGKVDGGYRPPAFAVRQAARPLALFCYLVHILRDFEDDQAAGLDYFAADLVRQQGLTRDDLPSIAHGAAPTERFRGLIAAYARFALHYEAAALDTFEELLPRLDRRYGVSLWVVHALYRQVLERIEAAAGRLRSDQTHPSPTEVRNRLGEAIAAFWLTGH